jgi:hypothetical protein
VEFGAGDGLRNSNTARLLRESGWRGVMIEASDYRFGQLRAHWGGDERVRLVQARVLPDTVERVFEEAGVPADLDLLSIDIDGNDYWCGAPSSATARRWWWSSTTPTTSRRSAG